MDSYLDASVLVALLGREASSGSVSAWLEDSQDDLMVSNLARAEASAALARQARIGALSATGVEEAFGHLDAWTSRFTNLVEIVPSDLALATHWVRRLDLSLRAPDAMHVAAARRLGAMLVTLDKGQAAAAVTLGLTCLNPADPAN